ncbi:TnsA endonuclease N-terminal domain-containing protein [Rhodopseudomonas sp. BR0G17]|uniref:TnsA endonuclease N-terminal domain-containing protein n=1 Tax=Rhodopseudomonas sp. BR0G17 TaxID=2269368 RepID=UPI0013DEA7A3|nr:TnsA endonuclease N-terminal domain-containing protein [Rhodopseudomonas sp. BR0G17]NEW97155.1 hypothetical protein [Rhodopseudomonas sp. BR0G17]
MKKAKNKGPVAVRNPKRLFTDNFTGTVNLSRGDRGAVQFESLLEQDWITRTDAYEHDLVSVRHQPMRIRVWDHDKYKFWTPDFLLERKNRIPALVEVKPLESVYPKRDDPVLQARQRLEVKHRFQVLKSKAEALGYEFQLATENEIRIEPSLQNAVLMLRCVPSRIPPTWCGVGRTAALQLPRRSLVSAFEDVLPPGVDALAVALYLAWAGEITLDPNSKWSRRSTFVRGRKWFAPEDDMESRFE